ncbi:MAG TPA: PDZ domain-containing protein, partial [Thermoanaerobaculia bacterium]|nr:PDZ domain-containing protein [Thermoanaerobaculia bacterium]
MKRSFAVAVFLFASSAHAAGCKLATFGVEVTNLSRASRQKSGIPADTYGVVVTEVLPGSPAASAGVVAGDAIVAIDERPVH